MSGYARSLRSFCGARRALLDLLSHGIMVGKTQAGSGLDGLAESSWATIEHAASADSLAPQP